MRTIPWTISYLILAKKALLVNYTRNLKRRSSSESLVDSKNDNETGKSHHYADNRISHISFGRIHGFFIAGWKDILDSGNHESDHRQHPEYSQDPIQQISNYGFYVRIGKIGVAGITKISIAIQVWIGNTGKNIAAWNQKERKN